MCLHRTRMVDLLDIVIPFVKEEWQKVAFHLHFHIDSVDASGKNITVILTSVLMNYYKIGGNQTMECVLRIILCY